MFQSFPWRFLILCFVASKTNYGNIQQTLTLSFFSIWELGSSTFTPNAVLISLKLGLKNTSRAVPDVYRKAQLMSALYAPWPGKHNTMASLDECKQNDCYLAGSFSGCLHPTLKPIALKPTRYKPIISFTRASRAPLTICSLCLQLQSRYLHLYHAISLHERQHLPIYRVL
ncbi:hypothetical protein RRG08_038830 [Elysia crispata]|uniref:Secreted protein n=1 Tax=Elysia crispata TaxID=231223 RepID=A0AAE0YSD6_9GAST|nr:hypothetical protein RRG08_038830 [Elysia crispata]